MARSGTFFNRKNRTRPRRDRDYRFCLPFPVDSIYEGSTEDRVKAQPYLIALIMVSLCLPAAHAQEYGRVRALNQRAAYIIQQRNDFVAQVLTSYAIPHERNEQGAVLRINMDGEWLAVSAVEIVPVLRESAEKQRRVTAHELLFYTSGGLLYLISELNVR